MFLFELSMSSESSMSFRGMWGVLGRTGNQVIICFPHLYKKRCFYMYQDVVTPKQHLVYGLSNILGDEKKRSSSVQSNV
jgi:hypothetical protein